MGDRWDVKCREVYMDNSQKYQIWLNGIVVGEIVNRFDAVEKLRKMFEQIEALQQENEELQLLPQKISHEMMDRIEQLKHENEQIRESAILAHKIADAHVAEIEQLRAQVGRMMEALEHIAEYWNRDNNEKAMEDACWHVIETAKETLAEIDKAIGGGENGSTTSNTPQQEARYV